MEPKIFDQEKFESLWIEINVKRNLSKDNELSDDEYIDYHIWEDINWKNMYDKHLPKAKVLRGEHPIITFHGGCHGCLSQRTSGIDRCKGCMYFRANWNMPSLFIEGEDMPPPLTQKDLDDLFK